MGKVSSIDAARRPGFFLVGLFFAALFLAAVGRTQAQGAEAAPQDVRFKAGEAIILNIPLDTGSVLNGGYPIDEAGYVDIPVAGKFKVSGRKRQDVEDFLAKKLSEYLRDVHIMALPAVRVTFLGHWMKPGMAYVDATSSLWEVIHVSGGPASEVNLDKMQVMRGGQPLAFDALEAFSNGTTFVGAGLKSGDLLIIPDPNGHHGWYWFREGLGAAAEAAGIITATLLVYITFTNLHNN